MHQSMQLQNTLLWGTRGQISTFHFVNMDQDNYVIFRYFLFSKARKRIFQERMIFTNLKLVQMLLTHCHSKTLVSSPLNVLELLKMHNFRKKAFPLVKRSHIGSKKGPIVELQIATMPWV